MKRFGSVLALCLLASACSRFENNGFIPFLKKESEAAKIIKEDPNRVSVLTFDKKLSVDAGLDGQDIVLPPERAVTSWGMAGGNPSRAIGHAAASGPLNVLWRRKVADGSGKYDRLTAQPVVDQGRIFVFDADQNVRAFDLRTGKSLWSKHLSARNKAKDGFAFGGGVAAEGGRVYVASGFGVVAAYDAATGQEIWHKTTGSPMVSAPAVSTGRVFAVSDDNEIFAMDSLSGDVLWTYEGIADAARIAASPAPAIAGDTVIATFGSGEIVALRAENGRNLWSDALTRASRTNALSSINDIAGGAAIDRGMVLASSHSGVTAGIDLRTGDRVWSAPAASIQTPWIAGDVSFMVTLDEQLVAMDRQSGRVYWITQLPQYDNADKKKGRLSWAGPVLLGGKLMVVSTEGFARVFDAKTGQSVKAIKLGAPAYISPIVVDETALVLTDDGALVAIR